MMKRTNHQDRGNVYTLVIALLGLAKIVSQLAGWNWGIEKTDINEIANYVAVIVSIGGIYFNHSVFKRSFKKHD